MTLRNLLSLGALAHGLDRGARAAVRRGALMAAAGMIAAVGSGFVVFSAFATLRLMVGPELAALGMGMTLLALVALFARHVHRPAGRAEPLPAARLPMDLLVAPSAPVDPVTLAVFTAAFVLGRRLADRWRI